MTDVTFLVMRPMTSSSDDEEGIRQFHEERARLLHGLVEAVDVDVVDWGETDSPRAHEGVEIVLALGSAGVFTALVQVFRTWIERHKMKDVCVKTKAGDEICVATASEEDVSRLIRTLHLPERSRPSEGSAGN